VCCVLAIWLPSFDLRQERERDRWRLFLVCKRSALKHRVHAQLMTFGHPCAVSDLFGVRGRGLLEYLESRSHGERTCSQRSRSTSSTVRSTRSRRS